MKIYSRIIPIVLLGFAALNVSGCAGLKKAMGEEKVTPDEFRVVTTAPLVLPPEFNLRPPRPGEARPIELRPDLQAKTAVFGTQIGTSASLGERALIAQMGATNADPQIREILDDEAAKVTHKSEKFADKILSFGSKTNVDGSPLDAEAEAERLRDKAAAETATGGQAVKVQQNAPSGFKLPGL